VADPQLPTPRNHAPPSISPEHFPTSRRWRVLCRAPTLRFSWRHAYTTHLRRELAGFAHVGVAVRVLDLGARSRRGVGECDVCAKSRRGVGECDVCAKSPRGVGECDLGATFPRGIGMHDVSGNAHGAGRQREHIGIAPVAVGAAGAGEFVGNTRAGAPQWRMQRSG
jgi:hypothetical protein